MFTIPSTTSSNPSDFIPQSQLSESQRLSLPNKSKPSQILTNELGSSRGTSPPKGVPRKLPSKDLKKKIAIVSFLGALGFFLSTRVHFFGVPSKDHCAHALPSEEVQHNGKATLVEFDAELFEVGGN
ncbi:unnamed protein product [Sphenostylis stenocarpa]|uniref:Uncharacterized protein n=1 Tax=Sphenostylis stenocarpa TaxID=92480 RepID=A0AA86S590_9FABA|nr:unnamed protein product [Sphenostylis stenocarpa]